MTTHKGVRVRLLSPAGPLLDVGSYHLYLSAKLRAAGIIPTGPAAIEGEWVTLFPINLADGTAIELQVMPTEEIEPEEEEELPSPMTYPPGANPQEIMRKTAERLQEFLRQSGGLGDETAAPINDDMIEVRISGMGARSFLRFMEGLEEQ